MRQWGTRSQEVHDELDEKLARTMTRVRDEIGDISLTDGFRNEQRQNNMFDTDQSKVRWPDGKHNTLPSKAVDFQPYPRPLEENLLWASLAYYASAAILIGKEEGLTLRWGGDWNRNGNLTDQNFFDLFHLEIVETNDAETEVPVCPACGANA